MLKNILSIGVADFCFVRAGGFFFEMKLFVNFYNWLFVSKTSRNLFPPDICLYLIRFKLKLPIASLVSKIYFIKQLFHNIVIELKVLHPRGIWIVPKIKLGFLKIRRPMKTDSSSLGIYIFIRCCTFYDNFCDRQIDR